VAKILVADDNSNIQKMVGLALKDQGIDVVAVGNGEAAVRKISDLKPDLVLADVFMPVRNGYEVCRYVKEDSALAHIPVILLVGAFDPLDEQEAQRVGADGVLKKPFVPPDPLISMVKSALTRAGVSLGPAPVVEKVPAVPKRSAADLLSGGVSSKLAALSPEKLPEVMPEAVQEFPVSAPSVKIAAGSEPLAFGNLLDTSDGEDLAITAKPMIDLRNNSKWEEEADDIPEEKDEEEESMAGGWRPAAIDQGEGGPGSGAVSDWREQAFHGNSPAKSLSSHWAPGIEAPVPVEAANLPAVAVATAETKPAETPIPFSGDAWAAAMATGVEEKLAATKDAAGVAPTETEAAHEAHEKFEQHVSELEAPAKDAAEDTALETVPSERGAEPANWAAVPETAWEIEARKASMLASTWDAPKAFSVDDTQEVPVYSPEPVVEHAENSAVPDAAVEVSHYSAEPIIEHAMEEHAGEEPTEGVASEPAAEVSSELPEPQAWGNDWESAVPSEPVEATLSSFTPVPEDVVEGHSEPAYVEEPDPIEEPSREPAPETHEAEPIAAAPAAESDMDEIVSRVLGKMNPEVLQRVTREILKPVIEAIVRDEINKKS
jgi:CheY-like chemotaxis protein